MSTSIRFPNELNAEVVDVLPARRLYTIGEKLAAERLAVCSSFDKYLFDQLSKSALTFQNCWAPEHSSANLRFDALCATHNGDDAYGSARAQQPVPKKTKGIFYFEVHVKQGGIVNVGLGGPVPPFIVGYSRGSCSYDDTGKFMVSRRAFTYAPSFGDGDLVGCGLNLATRELFFTRNGHYLGVATILPALATELYPTVTLLDSTQIEANFGLARFLSCAHSPPLPNAPTSQLRRWEEAEAELGRNLQGRPGTAQAQDASYRVLLEAIELRQRQFDRQRERLERAQVRTALRLEAELAKVAAHRAHWEQKNKQMNASTTADTFDSGQGTSSAAQAIDLVNGAIGREEDEEGRK